MSTLTVGLIGCGAWGRLILRDLRALGAEVVVSEPDERAAADVRQIATVVRDLAGLPPVDAIIVATPARTHAEVVTAVLPRRVPILVEKPFTVSAADARRLADVAHDRLFVGHVWRYHPGIEMLGAIARSGELGHVAGVRSVRVNWTSPRTDVDTTWNLLPHDVTLAIEILGGIPTPRSAVAETHGGRTVGITAILGDSPWLVAECSNRYAEKRREVRLHCRDGVAVLRDPDAGVIEVVRGNVGSQADAMTVERRTYSGESALRRQLAAFLAFVRGGPPPKSNASEGLAVVETIVALRALARLSEPA